MSAIPPYLAPHSAFTFPGPAMSDSHTPSSPSSSSTTLKASSSRPSRSEDGGDDIVPLAGPSVVGTSTSAPQRSLSLPGNSLLMGTGKRRRLLPQPSSSTGVGEEGGAGEPAVLPPQKPPAVVLVKREGVYRCAAPSRDGDGEECGWEVVHGRCEGCGKEWERSEEMVKLDEQLDAATNSLLSHSDRLPPSPSSGDSPPLDPFAVPLPHNGFLLNVPLPMSTRYKLTHSPSSGLIATADASLRKRFGVHPRHTRTVRGAVGKGYVEAGEKRPWLIHLGKRVRVEEGDEDGRQFVEELVEEVLEQQESGEVQEGRRWVTIVAEEEREVRPEELDSDDSAADEAGAAGGAASAHERRRSSKQENTADEASDLDGFIDDGDLPPPSGDEEDDLPSDSDASSTSYMSGGNDDPFGPRPPLPLFFPSSDSASSPPGRSSPFRDPDFDNGADPDVEFPRRNLLELGCALEEEGEEWAEDGCEEVDEWDGMEEVDEDDVEEWVDGLRRAERKVDERPPKSRQQRDEEREKWLEKYTRRGLEALEYNGDMEQDKNERRALRFGGAPSTSAGKSPPSFMVLNLPSRQTWPRRPDRAERRRTRPELLSGLSNPSGLAAFTPTREHFPAYFSSSTSSAPGRTHSPRLPPPSSRARDAFSLPAFASPPPTADSRFRVVSPPASGSEAMPRPLSPKLTPSFSTRPIPVKSDFPSPFLPHHSTTPPPRRQTTTNGAPHAKNAPTKAVDTAVGKGLGLTERSAATSTQTSGSSATNDQATKATKAGSDEVAVKAAQSKVAKEEDAPALGDSIWDEGDGVFRCGDCLRELHAANTSFADDASHDSPHLLPPPPIPDNLPLTSDAAFFSSLGLPSAMIARYAPVYTASDGLILTADLPLRGLFGIHPTQTVTLPAADGSGSVDVLLSRPWKICLGKGCIVVEKDDKDGSRFLRLALEDIFDAVEGDWPSPDWVTIAEETEETLKLGDSLDDDAVREVVLVEWVTRAREEGEEFSGEEEEKEEEEEEDDDGDDDEDSSDDMDVSDSDKDELDGASDEDFHPSPGQDFPLLSPSAFSSASDSASSGHNSSTMEQDSTREENAQGGFSDVELEDPKEDEGDGTSAARAALRGDAARDRFLHPRARMDLPLCAFMKELFPILEDGEDKSAR
ncbi:hypothetical protein JCM6882_004749 [Rhodosporidiobolus microsporus]